MYPKVKVREEGDEADQYAYEKSSLQSLKAFEWFSLGNHHSSPSSASDESPRSVVRVPWSSISKSPPPSFYAPKEINKKKLEVVEEPKNIRATSAPRPRAVLSSPVNDKKIGSRTPTRQDGTKIGSRTPTRQDDTKIGSRPQARKDDMKFWSRTPTKKDDTKIGSAPQAKKELLPVLKNHGSSQNRHAQCKIFPKSTPAGTFEPSQSHNKTPVESKNNLQAKVKTPVFGSSSRATHQKRVAIASVKTPG